MDFYCLPFAFFFPLAISSFNFKDSSSSSSSSSFIHPMLKFNSPLINVATVEPKKGSFKSA